MSADLFAEMRRLVLREIAALLPDLPAAALDRIEVTPSRDPAHGDMATNAALVAARPSVRNPQEIAAGLAARLAARPGIAGAEPAGPGFVNLTLEAAVLREQIPLILRAGTAYGDGPPRGFAVNVEYVSANPTGPLHVGHCRGAVVGDALASLLQKAGYAVSREYYVNDAGAQVIALARSVYVRYLQALGRDDLAQDYIAGLPGGLQYGGAYLAPVGAAFAQAQGDRFAGAAEEEWLEMLRDFAIARMLELIREDLAALGVQHDVFTSERALLEAGGVARALDRLQRGGLLYEGVLPPPKGKLPDDWEAREQTLFRATRFGDDIDRPVRKSDGSNTYFANDIACHADKLGRGFDRLIDVLGADHGGYVKRLQAAVRALAGEVRAGEVLAGEVLAEEVRLDVVLCQIVRVMRDGAPMRMSKRAGTFVELRDLIDEVGPDAVRFLMLMRKSDAQMEFDLDAAVAQTRDNPVFYVQYAHARCRSVLRLAGEPADLASAKLETLRAAEELALIRRLIAWPRAVETAAAAAEPHRIAFFLHDLAADFHALWHAGRDDAALRFIQESAPEATAARLALVAATAVVLRSGLAVLGVNPVEEMR